MSVNTKILSVVVPITKMAGNLQNLTTWLTKFDHQILEVLIIHDRQDPETGIQIREILGNIESKEIILIEDVFGSPGAARNAGLILCTCPWIAFWDGDDEPLVDEFLEMIYQAESENMNVAIGGYSITSASRIGPEEKIFLPSIGEWGSNIPFNPGIWRWAFKQEEIQGVKFNSFLMGEDQCFLFEVKPLTKKIYIHNTSVYRYTIFREGQLTRNKKAVNQIISSLKYLDSIISKQKQSLNYFELIIILKQSITAIKKGKISVKLYGLFLFLKVILKAIIHGNSSIITVFRSIFLFRILDRNNTPQDKSVVMLGGLGNQLFQLNTGLNVSQNKRLALNYSFANISNSSDTQLSQFSIPDKIQMVFENQSNFLVKKIINFSIRISSRSGDLKITNRLSNVLLNFLQRALGWIYPGNWKINCGVGYDKSALNKNASNFLGYFQTSQDINPYFERDLKLLAPSATYLEHHRELFDLRSLVVHVRLGDYAQEKYFGTPSREYFARSIEELWENGDYLRICLYSNDLATAKSYVPSHLLRYVWMQKQGEISDAETLDLMRYGSGYVISNSSFSWWAARLSHNSRSRVICPKPWFKNKAEPNMLIPCHWERRDS